MKVFKIVLISLVTLAVLLCIAAVVVIKTIDINKFKPQIIEQAGKALSRGVDFQSMGIGIGFNGIGLKINGLTISEDPAFGKGEFLFVKNISVGIDVLGYLLRRQISITTVVIDGPRVTVIRTKEGAVNAQTIAQSPGGGSSGTASPTAALPVLLISSLKGQNGSVTYIDHFFEPPIILEASSVGFTVNKVSLSDPFPFTVQASVLSGQQNIKVEGKCQLDLKNVSARVFDLKADTDLSRLTLKKLAEAIPIIPAQALPAELKGALVLSVPQLEAGVKGLSGLNADANLTGGMARFTAMAAPIKDIIGAVKITEKDITAHSFSAAIGQGTVRGSGSLKNYLAGQDYSFEFNAQKLSLADLVAQEQLPVKIEGLAAAKGTVKGNGFAPEAVRSSLVGEATADITGARLKDLNVLTAVLGQIPVIGESIKAGLPDTYKERLDQKDTVFSDITIPITIVNGRIIINDTAITSEGLFTINGKGEAGFDGTYTFEGSFLIAPDLSKAMVASVKQTQYLLNEQQMIFLPVKISGSAGQQIQISVDATYITKKLLENQARQQILKGLDKFLGGQQQEAQPGTSGAEGQSQPQSQEQPPSQENKQELQQTVDTLLKGIFK